ncbi:2,3-diketo-5-methylthio-1-phosphopentane phosphatase [Rhizobium sp. BE258]|nr:2,3-diketo-5-methylthio-1-phosphopentane phosphatase [Rhizobium sp. BE258]
MTDLILERFARPQWHEIEDQWANGKITSAQCMQRQVRLIDATCDELDAFLDTVEIDSDFVGFMQFCDMNELALSVVSDGVEYFIRRVLRRHGLSDIPVIANRLVTASDTSECAFDLKFPLMSGACAAGSGVCKCAVVRPPNEHIYIGDGRSDFCVSNEAMVVFAKAKLADYCRSQRIAFFPYDSFADIQRSVAAIISSPSPQRFALSVAQSA